MIHTRTRMPGSPDYCRESHGWFKSRVMSVVDRLNEVKS